MAADRTARIWDEVRKALGRMAGRVSSRSLPEAQNGITVTVRHSAALEFVGIESGVRQEEWRAVAQVRDLPSPAARAGGYDLNPASLATVIGTDRALAADMADVLEARCRFTEAPAHAWSPGMDPAGVLVVRGESVGLDRPPVRQATVTFGPPGVRAGVDCQFTPPAPKPDATGGWLIRASRVRAGMVPILRIPIVRPRLAAPPGGEASVRERRGLAVAADVPEADVALVGIFPHVPLGAVHKLTVTPDGTTLQVWVRPDMAGRGVGTVTVVLGRHRPSGRLMQAVRRADAGPSH